MSIKKFPFNDQLTMHLLHYQQVRYGQTSSSSYSYDKVEGERGVGGKRRIGWERELRVNRIK